MSLIVVNPTHHRKPKAAPAAAPKRKHTMAKKRRSAAQKAATRRMLAARRHRNPTTHSKRARRRNPAHSRKVYTRRRRNPIAASGLMGELLSKEGLMMVAAVVGTPTLTELAVTYVMPTATGTTRSLVKAGLGAAIAWGVYKYVSKKAGVVVGLVSIGSAVSDVINSYMAPGSSSLAASNVIKGYLPKANPGQVMGGYSEPGVVRL